MYIEQLFIFPQASDDIEIFTGGELHKFLIKFGLIGTIKNIVHPS